MDKTLFETERLYLKTIDIEDGAFFLNLWNSPNWINLVGDRNVRSIDQAKGKIKDILLACYKNHGYGMYKMVSKKSDETIGICGFSKRTNLIHPDIGFAVLPKYERKGYSLEAAKATMIYAKTELGLKKVIGMTTEDNIGSKKLLQKIGLKNVGETKIENSDIQYLLYSN